MMSQRKMILQPRGPAALRVGFAITMSNAEREKYFFGERGFNQRISSRWINDRVFVEGNVRNTRSTPLTSAKMSSV